VRSVLVSSRSFGGIAKTGRALLEAAGFEVQLIDDRERPLTVEKMAQIAARRGSQALICGAEPITRDLFRACPDLAMVMKHGVGIDNIDIAAASEFRVVVANAPGTNTDSVADLAVTMMLALLRRLYEAVSSTRTGGWGRYVGHELGALTIGVVGTGKIGLGVIRRLQGFGSKVLAYDVVHNVAMASQLGYTYVSLDELLRSVDIVTLHAPLLDETRNMIGRRELGLMKPGAYLVNLARGELVDEAALCEALARGGLAGAAVDVYAVEPPQSSPLLKQPNVLATPHVAAYTYEAMECMDRECAQTIIGTFQGIRCPNVLNPEVLAAGPWSPTKEMKI
jgi:D-3-phosphoglycerate dehydrogenase